MTDVDLDALAQAIREQPAPPCDSCPHVAVCTIPEACGAFRIYVERGITVKPPRQPPRAAWREYIPTERDDA